MAKVFTVWTYSEQGAAVQLIRKSLMKSVALSFQEWSASPDLHRLYKQAATAETDIDGKLAIDILGEDTLILSHRTLAAIDDGLALRLGLAETTTARLDLKSKGVPPSDTFCIQVGFVDRAGRATRRTVQGAVIHFGNSKERLPEPMYSVYLAAIALRDPIKNRDVRFERVAILCEQLNATFGTAYSYDDFLKSIDIAYASNLSIKTDMTPEGLLIEPLLFGRHAAQSTEDSSEAPLKESESLLGATAHRAFIKGLAKGYVGPSVKLGRNRFVYLPPAVRVATSVVNDASKLDKIAREDFIRNPRPAMRDAMQNAGVESDPEEVFVPTDSYSARVQGIGYWKAPVLPWIINQGHSWIPEQCGVKVGERLFTITPENAIEVLAKLDVAEQAGQSQIDIQGETVDISTALRSALELVSGLPRADDAHQQNASDLAEVEKDAAEYQKHFLVIEENFEDMRFSGQRGTELKVGDVNSVTPPENMLATLKSYQIEGLDWLAGAQLANHRGALLADDMGLGKTLQTLAAIAWRRDQVELDGNELPTLIVAPTALIRNWIGEMERHFKPNAFSGICVATGRDIRFLKLSAKRDTHTGMPSLDTDKLRRAGIVLTTYETLRDYHLSFAKVSFGIVVFDEIQKLKNPETQLTRAAKTINAKFWIGLTGTPVENRLHDLWSITDVLWPGLLGSSKDFNTEYADGSDDALNALESKLRPPTGDGVLPFLVRRMKADRLKDLPTKTIVPEEAYMPLEQADTIRAIVAEALRVGPDKQSILKIIQDLRSASLHPLKVEAARHMDADVYVQKSARLTLTIQMLKRIQAKDEKALIFLESLDLQDWLAGYLKGHFNLDNRPFVINGGVAGDRRQDMVDEFQSRPDGFDVMILSPKAGGVGLTLTAANHVIHLSRWWNPAVEDQATDRVYRIGQTKPVLVHVPMAIHPDDDLREGSFDRKLDALLEQKRALSTRLLAPSNPNKDSGRELYESILNSGSTKIVKINESKTITTEKTTVAISPLSNGLHEHGVQQSDSQSSPSISNLQQTPRQVWNQDYNRSFDGSSSPIEVLSFLNGSKLKQFYLEDPFCALPKNRAAVFELLNLSSFKLRVSPFSVIIRYYGTAETKVREQFESASEREVKQKLYSGVFDALETSDQAAIKLDLRPCTSKQKYLHDRVMMFQTETDKGFQSFKVTLPHDILKWQSGKMTGDIGVRAVNNSLWNAL